MRNQLNQRHARDERGGSGGDTVLLTAKLREKENENKNLKRRLGFIGLFFLLILIDQYIF